MYMYDENQLNPSSNLRTGYKMAEGGVRSDTQGQSSGSEFVFDFYCEVCKDDGLNNEAQGYCVDCEEYLCDFCIRVHKKSRQSRTHDLLDQESMPKDTPLQQDRIRKDITTKCETHRGKTVDFYCASHDTFGCSHCFATVHRSCAEIESIQDKSENILDSKDYKDFVGCLQNMVRKSRDMIAKTHENVTKTEQCCSGVMSQIRKLREEFNVMFDELEQNVNAQAEEIVSKDKANMGRLKEELETLSEAVDKIRSECEDLANTKRVCQLYIEIKKGTSEMTTLVDNLTKAEHNNVVRTFQLEPNNDLKDSFRSNGLGKIIVSNEHIGETSSETDKRIGQNITDTTAVHVSDINVRTSTDKHLNYYIIGSAVMSSTRMIIADVNTKKVTLLDTCTQKVVSELQLPYWPFDVAMINENLAAVSLLLFKSILLIKVDQTLSIDREISVQGMCRGVAYSQNKVLVTFKNTPRLEILDLQGNVIKTIDKDRGGKKIFSDPRHVCVSYNGDSIYVSDANANKVFCLTFEGVVKSVYSGPCDPQKVCVNRHGHFFVAGSKENTVHMVASDCTKSKAILTQADGLNWRVLSVSLCHHTNRLYVGMEGSPTIKVYQLS